MNARTAQFYAGETIYKHGVDQVHPLDGREILEKLQLVEAEQM